MDLKSFAPTSEVGHAVSIVNWWFILFQSNPGNFFCWFLVTKVKWWLMWTTSLLDMTFGFRTGKILRIACEIRWKIDQICVGIVRSCCCLLWRFVGALPWWMLAAGTITSLPFRLTFTQTMFTLPPFLSWGLFIWWGLFRRVWCCGRVQLLFLFRCDNISSSGACQSVSHSVTNHF